MRLLRASAPKRAMYSGPNTPPTEAVTSSPVGVGSITVTTSNRLARLETLELRCYRLPGYARRGTSPRSMLQTRRGFSSADGVERIGSTPAVLV